VTRARESAVLDALHLARSPLVVVHGMPAVLELELGGDLPEIPVGLADASCLARLGVKGPGAARWLEAHGVELPIDVNSYVHNAAGGLAARLGRSEFFLEDQPHGGRVSELWAAPVAAPGVYPVPRQDAAFVLFGARAERVLAQTTNFECRTLCRAANRVVMTTMAGVSVLLLGYELGGVARYRIWCDPSFGPYLCTTLLGIVREAGGGATGLFTALGLGRGSPSREE
jgi:sarcosine oxidase, subunit gamma